MATESVNQLLSQGRAAASVGENGVAESYFRRAIEIEPDNVAAWLALSGVVASLSEKRRCLARVRDLDPDNEEAIAALAWVTRKENDEAATNALAEAAAQRTAPPAPVEEAAPSEAEETLYCANHPNVETVLRCNRCGKPICLRCAVRTPVGLRCRECVQQQRAVFYSSGASDYVIAAVVALALSLPTAYVMVHLTWLYAIFLGPVAGGIIAEAVRLATGRRRAPWTWLVVGACIVAGAAPAIMVAGVGFGLITILIYLALGVGAAAARLR